MRRLIAVGILLLASAGWADTTSTIDILDGSLNKTAAKFTRVCDPNQGGGPYVGKDVWVFNLPKEGNDAGVFVSVTATWSVPGGGSQTRTIPTDGGGISAADNNGTSKAWIAVPEGWTLTAATAVITGTAKKFVVTHTCTNTTTPEEPEVPSGTPTPSASSSTPSSGEKLPLTGTTTIALIGLGGVAIAAGAALRFLYRRRPIT